MDGLVYTALSGLKSKMSAQASIANNIANASTVGYRSDRVSFERLVLKGQQFETRQPNAEEVVDMDRRAGTIVETGQPLDVAIATDNWFAVQAADGTEAYTRRGDLKVGASGLLENGEGRPMIGNNGPITLPPYQSIAVAEDGTVSIMPVGAEPGSAPQIIDRLKLVSDQGSRTVKGLDNQLHVRGGGVLPVDLDAKVRVGALEQSNVNLTQALVDMIENQRAYEVQANLLKEAKQMDESAASLMRVQG
ncbi:MULTISPECIES: flagellar basal body rod protein FlgF [unclassified Sphingomonas]|jgi:flagellar basal-body rod protein FlgF|uniref:flagellar basal body rod protein FlgF n=1 Tax=unclassified Sphingomonas TaxID=196159 RepID=UPI000831E871|nr:MULTISPECIES: flagellar basal body rod protein FlgF [unclassified Sphingomonas]MCH4894158.1 flagellar hook-basal body complex protein [Sphingomonas sp. SFZ2018-12]